MKIGMKLHKIAPGFVPRPAFERIIPTAVWPDKGAVRLQFYVPERWKNREQPGELKFPILVNFHGGGFTLGSATDDARWAGAVNKQVDAVVVSVNYRLAPEFAFPTAVEDGVDAVMYVVRHAEELHIDVNKIGICGFSSGGNMAFTVPMRLYEEVEPVVVNESIGTMHPVKAGESADVKATVQSLRDLKIACVVAWYPSCDYTITREQRRETSVNKDKELSTLFTELFDESYLAPEGIDLSSPYLSPAVAPKHMLETLPQEIVMFTSEWDMLRAEGERLAGRLEKMGKKVTYHCVPKVPHGFDKAPNPLGIGGVKEMYKMACGELRRIFDSVDLASGNLPASGNLHSEEA